MTVVEIPLCWASVGKNGANSETTLGMNAMKKRKC